jgi:hypothetical protein
MFAISEIKDFIASVVAGTSSFSVSPASGASFTPEPSTVYNSSALEASAILKASGGTFRSLTAQVDATAPTGAYYVLLMSGSATVPVNGAVTILRALRVDHVNGVTDTVSFDEGDAGVAFSTGLTVCLSTTWPTKTISGSYCTFAGSVL